MEEWGVSERDGRIEAWLGMDRGMGRRMSRGKAGQMTSWGWLGQLF